MAEIGNIGSGPIQFAGLMPAAARLCRDGELLTDVIRVFVTGE
jgi:hypothetical protein